MKIINFNTGRFYGPEGQPITAIYFDDIKTIAFADHGRDMTGLLRNVEANQLNQKALMARYDHNDYSRELGSDDYRLTDLARLLKA